MFKEEINKVLDVAKVNMKADEKLLDDKGRSVPYPLVANSGHCYIFSGASRSGKTTAMINVLSKRAKDGVRRSYRGLYDDIIIVSPSLHTLDNNIFEDIADDKKFSELSLDVFDKIEEITSENQPDDKHTLVVFDDVATYLKNGDIQRQFINCINNRRHKNLNIYIICQVYNQVPAQIRKNIDLLFLFKPKTKMETESVISDYFMMPRQKVLELFNFVYKERFDFMILDLTLRKSAKYIYFRNYNQIIIQDENNCI